MERESRYFNIYEPDLMKTCLPLSSQVLPLTAEPIVKAMGSTMKLFQDQQLDEQNLSNVMTSDTGCVLNSSLN